MSYLKRNYPYYRQEQKQAPPPPEAPKVEEVLQIVENDAKSRRNCHSRLLKETQFKAVEVKYVQ